MNALIDLEHCRESMTISLNGVDHTVRLAGTIENPYFCGKDICDVLGYTNSKQALQIHVPSKYKKNLSYFYGENNPNELGLRIKPNSLGSNEPSTYHDGKVIYVNEPGLYALIMNSKTPFATSFQELVLETILPSIRRYGSYQAEARLFETMARLAIRDKSDSENIFGDLRLQESERWIKNLMNNLMKSITIRTSNELNTARFDHYLDLLPSVSRFYNGYENMLGNFSSLINPVGPGTTLGNSGSLTESSFSDDESDAIFDYELSDDEDFDEKVTNETKILECKICMTNKIRIALIKCGHTFCNSCVKKFNHRCAQCRTSFDNSTKIQIFI